MEEIAAEKVRAIITRDKPRDIYDLWFLLNKSARIDYGMVNKKLEYYEIEYSSDDFEEKVMAGRASWEHELSALLPSVPAFDEVAGYISSRFRQSKR